MQIRCSGHSFFAIEFLLAFAGIVECMKSKKVRILKINLVFFLNGSGVLHAIELSITFQMDFSKAVETLISVVKQYKNLIDSQSTDEVSEKVKRLYEDLTASLGLESDWPIGIRAAFSRLRIAFAAYARKAGIHGVEISLKDPLILLGKPTDTGLAVPLRQAAAETDTNIMNGGDQDLQDPTGGQPTGHSRRDQQQETDPLATNLANLNLGGGSGGRDSASQRNPNETPGGSAKPGEDDVAPGVGRGQPGDAPRRSLGSGMVFNTGNRLDEDEFYQMEEVHELLGNLGELQKAIVAYEDTMDKILEFKIFSLMRLTETWRDKLLDVTTMRVASRRVTVLMGNYSADVSAAIDRGKALVEYARYSREQNVKMAIGTSCFETSASCGGLGMEEPLRTTSGVDAKVDYGMANLSARNPSSVENLVLSHWIGKEALSSMPTFDGGVLEYLPWKRQVYSLIVNDRRGTVVQFNTLRSLLKGDAREKTSIVDVADPNPVARVFEVLDKHYGQPGAVLKILEDQIDRLSTPDPTNANQLEAFINLVKKTVATYDVHGKPVKDQYWFFRKIWNKLSPGLSEKYAERTPEALRNLASLLEFLERKEQNLRTMPQYVDVARKKATDKKVAAGVAVAEVKPTPAATGASKPESAPRDRLTNSKRIRPKPGLCPNCGSPKHGIEECGHFRGLSPNARLCKAYEACLCFRCLQVHKKPDCEVPNFKCPVKGCGKPHHEMLHGAGVLKTVYEQYKKDKEKAKAAAKSAAKTKEKDSSKEGD